MHTRLGRLAATAVGALALVTAPTRAHAQVSTISCLSPVQCTLTELFAGGSIQVDDKHFKNWGLEHLDASAGAVPNLSLIMVGGISSLADPDPNKPGPGIRFFGNGQLAISGVQYLDLRIDFRVAVTAPGNQIKDATAQFQSIAGIGKSIIRFNEFLTNNTGSIGLGQLVLARDFAFPPVIPAPTSDNILFPPQANDVYAEKNFYLEGTQPGDSAQIDQLDQRYSQMPEPGELLMLGCGSALLVLLSRRRARRANHPSVGGIS